MVSEQKAEANQSIRNLHLIGGEIANRLALITKWKERENVYYRRPQPQPMVTLAYIRLLAHPFQRRVDKRKWTKIHIESVTMRSTEWTFSERDYPLTTSYQSNNIPGRVHCVQAYSPRLIVIRINFFPFINSINRIASLSRNRFRSARHYFILQLVCNARH